MCSQTFVYVFVVILRFSLSATVGILLDSDQGYKVSWVSLQVMECLDVQI